MRQNARPLHSDPYSSLFSPSIVNASNINWGHPSCPPPHHPATAQTCTRLNSIPMPKPCTCEQATLLFHPATDHPPGEMYKAALPQHAEHAQIGEHEPTEMRRNSKAAQAHVVHCAHALWACMNRLCPAETKAQMSYSPLPPSSNKPPLAR